MSIGARVVLGLLWAWGIAVGIYLTGTDASLGAGLRVVVLAICIGVVPGLLLVSLTLKVGYAVAKATWPRAFNAFEVALSAAIMAGIAIAFVVGAWEERQKAMAYAIEALSFVAVLLAGLFSMTSSAFEAMTSLRGLLVIIAILLYQIVRRLDDPRRRS